MLKNLEDELTENRRIYSVFFDQSRGSLIEESLQAQDANYRYSIVEPPRRPVYAVSGSKTSFVIVSCIIGMVIGVSLAYGRDYFNQAVTSVDDVTEYLMYPTWAIVPKLQVSFTEWYESFDPALSPSANAARLKRLELPERSNGASHGSDKEGTKSTSDGDRVTQAASGVTDESQAGESSTSANHEATQADDTATNLAIPRPGKSARNAARKRRKVARAAQLNKRNTGNDA